MDSPNAFDHASPRIFLGIALRGAFGSFGFAAFGFSSIIIGACTAGCITGIANLDATI
jgi:hypothetical protein